MILYYNVLKKLTMKYNFMLPFVVFTILFTKLCLSHANPNSHSVHEVLMNPFDYRTEHMILHEDIFDDFQQRTSVRIVSNNKDEHQQKPAETLVSTQSKKSGQLTKPAHFRVPEAAPHCPPHRTPSKRVAFIITNYNMPERTNQIVESIRKKVKWPVDIIVVDNGSDLMKPSKYTTLRLEKNVQTTNGWLVGLQYAKSLAANRNICYFAYWIWITTCLYDETQKDILTPLAQFLIEHPKAAGIAPALTADSTTAWHHLKKSSGNKPRKVGFLDELGVLWRASFFDSVGWFDPDELRGFGVDIETGYLARYSGRDVYIHDGVTVKKESGIAYKMNRMNADTNEREVKAFAEMRMLLNRRYQGDGSSSIPPIMRSNDFTGTYTDRLGTWFDDYSKYPKYRDDGLSNIEIDKFEIP